VRFAREIIYFLCVSFFRRFLHTLEVRGSSSLSPTILFKHLYVREFGKSSFVPKFVPIYAAGRADKRNGGYRSSFNRRISFVCFIRVQAIQRPSGET